MAGFGGELAEHAVRLDDGIGGHAYSTQSATKTLVERVRPLLRLELKAMRLPSGENIGKLSNALSKVI